MSELRRHGSDRTACVQFDVQNLCRRYRRRIERNLSSTGDGAGDFRAVQKRAGNFTQEIAVRYRPNWKGVPKRNQSTEFYVSVARVRADGAGIFLPAGAGD